MSPRAAWRLESLGFTKVFHYVAGKADWSASGLPLEGRLASLPTAGGVARRGVLTCRLTDRVGEVRERMATVGDSACVVLNDEGIVMGRLRQKDLNADAEATAESVMESGPTTVRPDLPLADIVERMQRRGVGSVLVTTPDGRLSGILYRRHAEARLTEMENEGAPEEK